MRLVNLTTHLSIIIQHGFTLKRFGLVYLTTLIDNLYHRFTWESMGLVYLTTCFVHRLILERVGLVYLTTCSVSQLHLGEGGVGVPD